MDWNEFLASVCDRMPPAPEDKLHALERELGCTLPADYREFLAACNGGCFKGDFWYNEPLADGRPADVGLHHLHGIRDRDCYSLLWARHCYQSEGEIRIPLDLLPIADDPGGNAICVGIGGEHYGKVFFWDHECEPDPSEWDGRVETAVNIQHLTDSLREFVAGLKPMEDMGLPPDFDPLEGMRGGWLRLCKRLELKGDASAVWQRLRSSYQQTWRAYHNLNHVNECLLKCSACWDIECDRDAVEAAIWFHDAVYVVGSNDNEQRSAELAAECLTSLGASAAFVDRVAGLVLATDHRHALEDDEARLICDIDLGVLGRGMDIYDAYAEAVFAEMGLSRKEYAPHRQAFLRAMLARPHIYHTEHFRRQYERAARTNMQRELESWAG